MPTKSAAPSNAAAEQAAIAAVSQRVFAAWAAHGHLADALRELLAD